MLLIQNNFVPSADTNILSEKFINSWLKFSDVRQSSQHTYLKAIKQLLKYFNENQILHPTRSDIECRKECFNKAHKPSSIQLYIIAVRLFFKFLAQNNVYSNIAEHIKSPKTDSEHKKDALTIKQCRALLSATDISKPKGLRDRAIISLMMTAGLRTSQLPATKVASLGG